MNSWLRMNTCSCMSTWPRSAVSTAPRAVSTFAIRTSDLPVAPLPVSVANRLLAQLAIRVASERLDEIDGARALVVRELLAAELDERALEIGSRRHLWRHPRFDDRAHLLAPFVAGHADHRRV